MNQLMVLQDIYASLSYGGKGLPQIDPRSIVGSCPVMVGRLLESAKQGNIDEETCKRLADGLQDAYEIKRLGDICRRAGLLSLAVKSYQKALTLCSDEILRPVLQNNLGQAYARQGDLARAAFHYQKAASGFARAGDRSGLAHVQGNLGSAYRRSREWDRAIENCYRSLKTFEDIGDDLGIAQMTGSLGRIYADMGERELATRYFERSLRDFQRLGDKKSAAWVLDRLGRTASEGKDWDRALTHYATSLSIFEDLGQRQSAGVVLSNQGRMYLEMGDSAAACEALERAVQLVPRTVHPAYQNTLAGLAACYSLLGRDALQSSQAPAASQYFAQASDRHLELASSLKDDHPELKVSAGIARSRSILAKLSTGAGISDEEAAALSERALSALDGAAAICPDTDPRKVGLESLRRTVAGMNEARSLGLLSTGTKMSAKAAGDAVEYLMGGASCSGGTSTQICDALRHLRAAVEAEKSGVDPTGSLLDSAASLRLAETGQLAGWPDREGPGGESVENVRRAAALLEGMANLERPSGAPSGAANPNIARLDYRALRDAILPIGWALAEDSFTKMDDEMMLRTWDDDLNLVDGRGKDEAFERIRADQGEAETLIDPVPESERPVLEIRDEEDEGAMAPDAEMVPSEIPFLVPVQASIARLSQGQILLSPQMHSLRKVEIGGPIVCRQEIEDVRQMILEESEVDDLPLPEEAMPRMDSGSEEGGPDHATARHSAPPKQRLWSRSNAIILFQALMLLVLLLAAVEIVLYLV